MKPGRPPKAASVYGKAEGPFHPGDRPEGRAEPANDGSNCIVKSGKMRPKAVGRRRKIWKASKGVWKTCNPLKSHKTAKDLFGKAWSKTREFWRSLEKGLEGAFIPPPLAPATSGLRSSWIVIARSEVPKQPRGSFRTEKEK